MKQINFIKSHFGTTVSTESFIVDGIDCILHDILKQYIDLRNSNNKLNNCNFELSYEVVAIESTNRYDFYNKIKSRILFEQDVNEQAKARLEKLQKHADKHRKK